MLLLAYRHDHAVALANRSAASEEGDDEDYDANHNQSYRREHYTAFLNGIDVVRELQVRQDTHDQYGQAT